MYLEHERVAHFCQDPDIYLIVGNLHPGYAWFVMPREEVSVNGIDVHELHEPNHIEHLVFGRGLHSAVLTFRSHPCFSISLFTRSLRSSISLHASFRRSVSNLSISGVTSRRKVADNTLYGESVGFSSPCISINKIEASFGSPSAIDFPAPHNPRKRSASGFTSPASNRSLRMS